MVLCLNRVNKKCLCILMACLVVLVVYRVPPAKFHNGSPRSFCSLRDLDPWDESFLSELRSDKKIECATQQPLMYVNDTGYILFDKIALDGIPTEELNCFYQAVFRNGDSKVSFGEATVFYPPAFINSQTFLVTCTNLTGGTLYEYVHVNIAYNESSEREEHVKPESADKPSIIIIGVDSISRSHARRDLNLSLSYLTDTLGAYDFTGYNSVGENTFPNWLAMFAGTDWRNMFGSPKMNDYFDDLPLFWKNKTDYVTFMCENCPNIATFNYFKKGFQRQPADYYLRPAFIAMDSEPPFIFSALKESSHYYGDQLYFDIQLKYFRRFLTKYKGKQRAALFWNNDIGHNSLRYTKNADKPLLQFLHWLKSDSHLHNAILMLISDHGYRLGGASETPIGRLESTNPMFRLYVPDSLKKKHSWLHANLLYNRDKLVTGHDLYFSLLDIMDDNVVNASPREVSCEHLQPRRLFWKIPSDRTCEDAGIPYAFCLRCFQTTDLKESEIQNLNSIANISIMTLNKRLEKFDMCEQLTLKRVKRYHKITNVRNKNTGKEFVSMLIRNMFPNVTHNEEGMYLMVYETSPGDGKFQSLMKCDTNTTSERVTFEPVGMPLRINEYGTQSACVNETELKPICYCKD